jgi:hypothetical protein
MKKIGTLSVTAVVCLLFVGLLFIGFTGCPRPSEMMEPEDPDTCGGGREGKMAPTFQIDIPPQGTRVIDLQEVVSVTIVDPDKIQQIVMPRVEHDGKTITVFLNDTKVIIVLK